MKDFKKPINHCEIHNTPFFVYCNICKKHYCENCQSSEEEEELGHRDTFDHLDIPNIQSHL